jgi:hypothetical protein
MRGQLQARGLLPPLAAYLLAWCEHTARHAHRRGGGDRGEIGIIGAVIIAAGLAAAAAILVTAITGKLQSWIGKIPG